METGGEGTQAVPRRSTDRSPSYPGVPLDRAIERAQELYAQEKRNPAAVEIVLNHWGYKPRSGPGSITIAALRKFGLLAYEGSGQSLRARLTDAAMDILLRHPDDPERMEAIRKAALHPPLHMKMWNLYRGEWPSDSNFVLQLQRERNFTASGAREFVSQLRRTMEFAGFGKGATLSLEGAEKAPAEEVAQPMPTTPVVQQAPPTTGSPGIRSFTIPFTDGQQGVLQMPATRSEEDWALMFAVLNAMKPGIVRTQRDSAAEN